MPVGAFGGKREIMDHIAPTGPVYQAGTLSGNPVAMAAGLAALTTLQDHSLYTVMEARVSQLMQGFQQAAAEAGVPLCVNYVGGMFGFFFTEAKEVTSFAQATECNMAQFKAFYHEMLQRGIYLAPSAFEAGFMSMVHSEADIEETIQAARQAFAAVANI